MVTEQGYQGYRTIQLHTLQKCNNSKTLQSWLATFGRILRVSNCDYMLKINVAGLAQYTNFEIIYTFNSRGLFPVVKLLPWPLPWLQYHSRAEIRACTCKAE